MLLKLAFVPLVGYSAYALYERYGNRAPALVGPAEDFRDRMHVVAEHAANRVGESGAQAASTVKDAAAEAQRAAHDAVAAASRELDPYDDTPG